MATGRIAHAWQQTGRTRFAIREIGYAEVLRERAGGNRLQWNRIIESCLQGDHAVLDDAAIAALLQAVSQVDTFGDLLDHFQRFHAMSGVTASARAVALIQSMRSALDAVRTASPDEAEHAMQTMAAGLRTAESRPDGRTARHWHALAANARVVTLPS